MTTSTAFAPQVAQKAQRISPNQALDNITAYLTAADESAYLHPNAILTEEGPRNPVVGSSTGIVLHNLRRLQAGLQGKTLAADLDFEEDDVDGDKIINGEDKEETNMNGPGLDATIDDLSNVPRAQQDKRLPKQSSSGKAHRRSNITGVGIAPAKDDDDDNDNDNDNDSEADHEQKRRKKRRKEGIRDDVAQTVNGHEEADMDWQSQGEFARQQDILEGEIGPRDNAPNTNTCPDGNVLDLKDIQPTRTDHVKKPDKVNHEDIMSESKSKKSKHQIEQAPIPSSSKIDRDARKSAKKERRAQAKRDAEKRRQADRAAVSD